MGIIHKRNGGYIGVDYRRSFPSGIHVLGGVGRVTEVTLDVELYGGKGRDYFRAPVVNAGYGGKGGYTKFRVKLSSEKTLKIQPYYKQGGSYSFPGVDSSGGAGAGFLIGDEWIGVAGGGGGGGGKSLYQYSSATFLSESASNGAIGYGGYGTGAPSEGENAGFCHYYEPNDAPVYFGSSVAGSGGGGAPGGTGAGSNCYGSYTNPGPSGGGNGGGGNLRIYKDQSATSGNLSAMPDVYMQYITHSNGTHEGAPQVRITNVDTAASFTYTDNTEIKAVYIATGDFNP